MGAVNTGLAQNTNHVSSFGFGGTNGHAIFWGVSLVGPSDAESVFLKRLRNMQPPEVRVNGDDPSMWEWDGPDEVAKPGDKYSISINPTDGNDVSIRWTKEEEGDTDGDDGEDDFYCLTGPWNDWGVERMEDGAVTGLRSLDVEVPTSGAIEFRILKNGEEDQVIYPTYHNCSQKTAEVLGPASEDNGKEKNLWYIPGIAGQTVKIDFFACRGIKSLMWMHEVSRYSEQE